MSDMRYYWSSFFVLMLFFLFFVVLLFIPNALAVDFSCHIVTQASCADNTTEQGLIRMKNDVGGYNNAHAQLLNYSGNAYPYTLCCDTDGNHVLDNDCANENATIILRTAAESNSHSQVPSVNTYAYTACLALSPGNLTCEYVNDTCSVGYNPLLSMASSETNGGLYNQTNAHVANYSYYTLNVCCKGGNSPPSVPVLTYPTDGNDSVVERNVTLRWQTSSDPDGDPVTYEFNLTSATCMNYNATDLSTESYTPSQELCVDVLYDWTVRACDTSLCSDWATPFNFTVKSVLGLTFLVNNTDFGELSRNETDDTTDDNPPPFTVENTGNVPLNVSFKANDPLFEVSGLGNDTFQYEARVNESNAYDAGSSQTSWANVSASYTNLFTNLGYVESADAASINILVDLPYEEPAGSKSSTVQVQGQYG